MIVVISCYKLASSYANCQIQRDRVDTQNRCLLELRRSLRDLAIFITEIMMLFRWHATAVPKQRAYL